MIDESTVGNIIKTQFKNLKKRTLFTPFRDETKHKFYKMAKEKKHKHKQVLTDQSLQFLKNYINNPSPVGFESGGQKLWLEYIKPFVDTHFIDPYGTAVGVINPSESFKVVIEAHADEISWFVNYINDQGLIYLKRNGGVDHQVSRAKREVEHLGVHVGAVVTYEEGFDELAHDYYIGRAFDNRIGGFMIAEVARMLRENKKELPYGLYIVNAVQEEIGLRGAEMIARRIKPDVAIITDVTHDTQTPMINKLIEGDVSCGKGPSLAYGPAVHNKLLKLVEDVADKNKISIQMRTVSRSTGTDTDSFAYANDGCPSVLISIPLRYMHTTVEMLHKRDIEQTIVLMYETLLELTPKTNLNYL